MNLSRNDLSWDSAEWYENEKEVGQAILDFCKTDILRSEIFCTAKPKNNNGYFRVKRAITRSVKECGLGHIDLYLMYRPTGGRTARQESWKAICDAQKEGLIRTCCSLGVIRFQVKLWYDAADGRNNDYAAIPKSSRRDKIISNTHIFDFESITEEMDQLDALDESLVTDWDPTNVP
ncbi:hypothetical protein AN958_01972 [Leucoagaricus sp. SymC.cos]|nr:hypothetical protein AN958_01972 [Leucoagaricus sp. SymC.cos]